MRVLLALPLVLLQKLLTIKIYGEALDTPEMVQMGKEEGENRISLKSVELISYTVSEEMEKIEENGESALDKDVKYTELVVALDPKDFVKDKDYQVMIGSGSKGYNKFYNLKFNGTELVYRL